MTDAEPPPLDVAEQAASVGERATLEAFLDLYRGIVPNKLAGIGDADAARPMVASGTSLGGVVKHLRWVEHGWFTRLLGERAGTNARSHERDWEFRMQPGETIDQLLADYAAECGRSRRVAAGLGLDDSAPHPRLGAVSLRWVYVHLIEETARHAGHLDILREQLDGSTGDG